MPNSKKTPVIEFPAPFVMKFRKVIIVAVHILVFAVSLMISFLFTKNMQLKGDWIVNQYPQILLFVMVIKLLVFGFFKQYRGWWRYVGITDLFGIAGASWASTLLIYILYSAGFLTTVIRPFMADFETISQAIFLLDMFGTMFLLGGARMVVRLYHEEFRTVEGTHAKRFLIVGAGNAGEGLLREILRMRVAEYDVIGFIDDDPVKQGILIHGIPVLGNVDHLPEICEKKNIEEIAIAMPSATGSQLRRVIQLCEGAKVRFSTVPAITDIATGKLKVSQIRNVDINDLLGREVIELDLDKIRQMLTGKIILVTGAGGSIGSEMCRQVCSFEPKNLLLVEQAENALFLIDKELKANFPNVRIIPLICDITDRQRVEQIFEQYKPETVIHAAAHKHVPMMELNPGEAVKNNIVGTMTVSQTSDKFCAKNFVMISTDKAVNPTSIMGSTKRISEMFIQDLNRTSKTEFVTVRFGNVLGSNGSVVPIFKQQIENGGPVTVTHPEMRRYFMTIPEASQLVLQAATMGKGGEIFVLDMGEPVKIVDLARELITLSGFRVGEDIEIVFTGTRPGEKLFEELSIKGENMIATTNPKIAVWKNITMERESLHNKINDLINSAPTQNHNLIVENIKKLVPEYIGDE